jgi:hypothetical protein
MSKMLEWEVSMLKGAKDKIGHRKFCINGYKHAAKLKGLNWRMRLNV